MEFRFAPPAEIESINKTSRQHQRAREETVRAWRWAGKLYFIKAVSRGRRAMPPCSVQVTLPVKRRIRRDPSNFLPVVKPIIDGMVDAGAWPDDTAEWVTVMDPILEVGGKDVVVTLVAYAGDD